jgi:enoyl-CoA hydratase/carnithine racemase
MEEPLASLYPIVRKNHPSGDGGQGEAASPGRGCCVGGRIAGRPWGIPPRVARAAGSGSERTDQGGRRGRGAAEALAAIRRTITEGIERPFEEGLAIEREAVVALDATGNFAEGVRAFLEKRKPQWKR